MGVRFRHLREVVDCVNYGFEGASFGQSAKLGDIFNACSRWPGDRPSSTPRRKSRPMCRECSRDFRRLRRT